MVYYLLVMVQGGSDGVSCWWTDELKLFLSRWSL